MVEARPKQLEQPAQLAAQHWSLYVHVYAAREGGPRMQVRHVLNRSSRAQGRVLADGDPGEETLAMRWWLPLIRCGSYQRYSNDSGWKFPTD